MATERTGPRGQALVIVGILLAVVFGLLLGAAPPAAATTYVPGGTIGTSVVLGPTGSPVADTTYVLLANVTIAATGNVTVQPGTTILFNPGVHLYVQGALWAVGNASSRIEARANGTTTGVSWGGIEFDSGSVGRVSWCNISQSLDGVFLRQSSVPVTDNLITTTGNGIRAVGASSLEIVNNTVDRAAFGLLLTGSSGDIRGNRINGTAYGISATNLGSLTIANNTITNVRPGAAVPLPSVGIAVDGLTSVGITGNAIRGVYGLPGSVSPTPGGDGSVGAPVFGILVNGTGFATIQDNTLDGLVGGRGGNGANAVLVGGNGGPGGAAVGMIIVTSQSLVLQDNLVANVTGGPAGDGGGGTVGGTGGVGGGAAGIDAYTITSSPAWYGNTVRDIYGGLGGNGSFGTTAFGNGGRAGDAYGLLMAGNPGAQAATSTFDNIRGGQGGTSNPLSTAGRTGGAGGLAYGIAVLGADGTTTLHANTISTILGGAGGPGYQSGGAGGNATGAIVVGDGAPFNVTDTSFNSIGPIIGGYGGTSHSLGGYGGTAIGLAFAHVTPTSASDSVSQVRGGDGGNASVGNPAGQGGQAGGMAAFLLPSSSWSASRVQDVQRGGYGAGTPPVPSFGAGFYFLGDSITTTRSAITNATISGTSDDDLYLDNYTAVTTLNTPFSESKLTVTPAGNLTVQNYLGVQVRWPNNLTAVAAARIVVKDNGAEIYNRTSPSGSANWIVVTNRVYVDRPVPIWNSTQVSVSYQAFSFTNNPRNVNVTGTQTQYFTMVDSTPPTSIALALPPWTDTRTFTVYFSSLDGNGTGIQNVTLWYRLNGGSWVADGTTSFTLLGFGQFTFTAPSDGTFEFATTAFDKAGNTQQPRPPASNDTWTIVDTVAPASHVITLTPYQMSRAFTVRWAPDTGVTDISNYTIQVNTGSGWTDWLTNTTLTSATYAATADGPIAFRAVARDFAGNQESKTSNDTWTIVDTVAPQVVSRSPTGNLTSSPTTVVITFSEPMNTSSVQAALLISPSVNGTFSWSNGGRTLTLQISGSLSPGTTYTVTVGANAKDLAGNALPQAVIFTFGTPTPPPPSGLSLLDLWPLFVVIAAALAALAFLLVRRRGAGATETAAEATKAPAAAAPAKPEAAIDDVFLLYRRDGVLIKHETRRLRPDIDTDILSGMLTAVQQFVKDSFRGDEGEELNEMTVGQMHILIGRGKWLILAATITGGDMESMTSQIQACVKDMEDHHWDQLEDWDGDLDIAKVLGPYLKKLIRGEYEV